MFDVVVGPVISILNDKTLQISITHIGRENKFRYNNQETIFVNENYTPYTINQLFGRRIRCKIKFRDEYSRLCSNIELE